MYFLTHKYVINGKKHNNIYVKFKFIQGQFNYYFELLLFKFVRLCITAYINMVHFYKNKFKPFLFNIISYIPITFKLIIFEIILLILALPIVSCYFIKTDLSMILAGWLLIQLFSYLLLTGFIYLLNRNEYAANLPTLSRFWKRSFMVFWLLEAFLFACFSYLLLNEGQDLWVCKDSLSFFKTQHFFVAPFLYRISILCFTIIVLFSLLLSIESNSLIGKSNKFVSYVLVMTCLSEIYFTATLSHCLYTSCYELSITKSKFSLESKRLRMFSQYLLICSLAKFWHFVLILFCWFITIPSIGPKKNSQYGVISLSLQNLIAIYFLTILTTLPYIKYLYHNNLELFSTTWSFLRINQNLSYFINSVKAFCWL